MRLGCPSFMKHCVMWHRGKNRRPYKIKVEDLMKLRNDLLREERNMEILKHPYLTAEQSHGHMKEKKPSWEEKVLEFSKVREMKFEKYVTLEDRLNHLKVQDTWD